MARFLLTTQPIPGHINPMVPIARELVARGHDVLWYTGELFRPAVEKSGARYLPMNAAPDFDLTDPTVMPERHGLKGIAQLKFYLQHMLLDSAPGQVQDLAAYVERWPVDALFSDITFLGSLYLAELGGPPCAVLGATAYPQLSRDTAPYGLGWQPSSGFFGRLRNQLLNALVGRVMFADVNRYADRVRRSIGLPPTDFAFIDTAPLLSDLYLQATAAAFEYPRSDLPAKVHFIGPLIHRPSEPFEPPTWWAELDAGRPVVHVTQGTIATAHEQLMVPAIQALADEDVLVIATTGGKTAAEFPLSPLPANVRLEPFVPYHSLLPKVDVMITNAGYGGVQFALAHGVPLVAAGRTEDKKEICARLEWAGVGLTLPTESPSPRQIREAVRQILGNPRYREDSRRLKADFDRHDAPREAADLLEQFDAGRAVQGAPQVGARRARQ
ncbi:MAG: glycosyltransferase [Acidobacteriota bacterium]